MYLVTQRQSSDFVVHTHAHNINTKLRVTGRGKARTQSPSNFHYTYPLSRGSTILSLSYSLRLFQKKQSLPLSFGCALVRLVLPLQPAWWQRSRGHLRSRRLILIWVVAYNYCRKVRATSKIARYPNIGKNRPTVSSPPLTDTRTDTRTRNSDGSS
jgi:hypothetical protein